MTTIYVLVYFITLRNYIQKMKEKNKANSLNIY